MKFYYLEPEVAGLLGERTVFDQTKTPPEVRRLHYEFDTWLGDDLLGSLGGYIGTVRLQHLLEKHDATGLQYQDVEVTVSSTFNDLFPTRRLPHFVWFKVVGEACKHDFGVASDGRLVVSERALHIMKSANLNHCAIAQL
jgi:hypothetical protein